MEPDSKSPTVPPGARPAAVKAGASGEDPWSAVSRETLDALHGDPQSPMFQDELGDTARLLREDGNESLEVGQGASSEILQLLAESLKEFPERVDLWLMRFEVFKTQSMKREFAEVLQRGWDNPRLRRALDWRAIRQMWEELAPGEPVPAGIKLPESLRPSAPAASGSPAPQVAASIAAGYRRFSDLAAQMARAELELLTQAYAALRSKPGFFEAFVRGVAPLLKRPTLLHHAEGLGRAYGGAARIFLKREDLRQVTPETENAAAQAYIAAALGKRVVITGNDVDAHSLALAAVAPRFELKCIVVLRASDFARKPELIGQLRELGARLESMAAVQTATPDPREAALRLWQRASGQCHLALSLGSGPKPYATMVSDLQSLLGRETELQLRAHAGTDRPRTFVAAVHSEADSIGFVLPQLFRPAVELVYAEPEPGGLAAWQPSARLRAYNGAIREHAMLRATGRITHIPIADAQAYASQQQAAGLEGINLSLEDARALALTCLLVQRDRRPRDLVVLVA